MFTTLACLALAMTVCALLLAWIEPPSHANAVLTDPDFARRQAAQAMATDPGVARASWQEVEIATASGGGTKLAATAHRFFHFIVSNTGAVHTTQVWQRQQFTYHQPGRIRIGIIGPLDHSTIPIAQWLSLRALINSLIQEALDDGSNLQVWVGPSLVSESPPNARWLRSRLALEGFQATLYGSNG